MNPIYFNNGNFYDLEKYETFSSSGKFTVRDKEIVINRNNLRSICSEFSLPHSMTAGKCQNVEFIKDLEGLKTCFFDIETDPNLDFLFGYVNEKKFDKLPDLIRELLKYDVIVGFNIIRFDLPYMRRRFPSYFDTIYYSKNFMITVVPNKLILDARFWYNLAEPYLQYHSMSELLKTADLKEERAGLNDKDARCQQDVKILQAFYPRMKGLFNAVSSVINSDWYVLQSIDLQKLRRWMFFQTLINKGLIPFRPEDKGFKRKPKIIKFVKKGLFKNIWHWDVSGAYPNTAINSNLSLCYENDFSNFIKLLIDKRKEYEEFSTTFKFLANAFIGDQYDLKNYFKDSSIWHNIVNTFGKKMQKLVKENKKDLVFSNTDCLALKKEKRIELDGYNVELRHKFSWVSYFDVNKYIGWDSLNKKPVFKKFPAPYRIKLFDYLDGKLLNGLDEKNWKILKNPVKLLNGFDELSLDMFKITAYKSSEDESCSNADLWKIWDSLPKGFSEIFLTSSGHTTDPKKVNHKRYKRDAKQYLNNYRLRK